MQKRMRRIMVSSVACPVLRNFSTLSHVLRDFLGGKKLLNTKCFFSDFLYNFCPKRFSLQEEFSEIFHHKCMQGFM